MDKGLGARQSHPPVRVLIACEYSGIVRDAFTRRGFDATSCDLLPTEQPGQHYQGDVSCSPLHEEIEEALEWLDKQEADA